MKEKRRPHNDLKLFLESLIQNQMNRRQSQIQEQQLYKQKSI